MRVHWPLAFALAMFVMTAGAAGAQEPSSVTDAAVAEMMQRWEAYGAVGEAHAELAKHVGVWDVRVRIWPAPVVPPTESTGRSVVESIMGGRYLLERFTGTFAGAPFEGLGLVGFDNLRRSFVSTWIDSMSTGIMSLVGHAGPDAGMITFVGQAPDPASGGFRQQRTEERWVDADTRTVTTFEIAPDGSEFKAMELTYRRRAVTP